MNNEQATRVDNLVNDLTTDFLHMPDRFAEPTNSVDPPKAPPNQKLLYDAAKRRAREERRAALDER